MRNMKKGMAEYAEQAGYDDVDEYTEQVGEDELKAAVLRDKVTGLSGGQLHSGGADGTLPNKIRCRYAVRIVDKKDDYQEKEERA